jgi:hypothetical protein
MSGPEYKLLALILMLYEFQPILGHTPLAYSTIRAEQIQLFLGGRLGSLANNALRFLRLLASTICIACLFTMEHAGSKTKRSGAQIEL